MRLGAIAFLTGVLLAQQLSALPAPFWLFVLSLTLPSLLYARSRPVGLLVLGFLWALWRATLIVDDELASGLIGQDIRLQGYVAALPQVRENGVRFEFDVVEAPGGVPRRVRLSWYGYGAPALTVGQRWDLEVRLKPPRGFMNPGGFDYEAWLFQQRIRATGYVRNGPDNRLLADEGGSYPVGRLRQYLQAEIGRALDGRAYTGIVTALAIGDRQGIAPDQWQVFRRTGTSHLVAISGLHVGLVAGLLFFLVRYLWSWWPAAALRWPAPKAGAVAALLGACAYAALAGFSVPTQRAMIMVTVALGAILLQRSSTPGHALALACLLVLLHDPFAVMSAGFWLSFGAVAIILYGMSGRVGAQGLWWKWGRVQVLVGIGLLPGTVWLFNEASLVSPLANVLAVPWISIAVVPPTLLGALTLPWLPAVGTLLLQLAEFALGLLWWVLQALSDWRFAQWRQQTPPLWTLLPAVLGVALLLAPRGLPGRWLGLLALLPLLVVRPAAIAPGEARVTVLDVGQGLAAVVRTRDHVLVYDAGPRFGPDFDAGGAVLLPFLEHHGARRIDALLLSQEGRNHTGGLTALLDALPVERLLAAAPARLAAGQAARCLRGERWEWDGVVFEVLHPPATTPPGRAAGCVLRVVAGEESLLLPGDIGLRSQRQLAASADVRADVLVAPHGGGGRAFDAGFAAAVAPRHVVFSVGHGNRQGLPHAEVLEAYRKLGAEHWDTVRHGAVEFTLGTAGEVQPRGVREGRGRYWHDR